MLSMLLGFFLVNFSFSQYSKIQHPFVNIFLLLHFHPLYLPPPSSFFLSTPISTIS